VRVVRTKIESVPAGVLIDMRDHAMHCPKCFDQYGKDPIGTPLIVQLCDAEKFLEHVEYYRAGFYRHQPPVNAEFLLHLVLPDDRIEDAIGDLSERFVKKVERLGIARANIWFYKQVACSILPYAKAAARRLSSGFVSQTIVLLLRVLGQNGLADEVVRARAKTKTR
jgi:hypothetical protein